MKKIVIALISLFITGLSGVYAQDLAAAADEFNKAIGLSKESKFAEAAAAYENTINICKQLGDEGMELQIQAEQQLPGTYFNLAKGQFEAKSFSDAITNFEKSAQYADQMGEEKTADAARTYLSGIYYAMGNSDLKNDKLDEAIEKYNKSLSYKADYYKAFYGLGLVYKKKEDLSLVRENMDKAIAGAEDDEKIISNAKNAVTSSYQKAGALQLQSGKYTAAIENLLISLEYDNTEPRTYYYLAISYNGLSKWDDAIAAANKALELQTEDKSDIYFELAKAQEGKGDKASACANYKNVTGGNNVEAAKYQIGQVLKCN